MGYQRHKVEKRKRMKDASQSIMGSGHSFIFENVDRLKGEIGKEAKAELFVLS